MHNPTIERKREKVSRSDRCNPFLQVRPRKDKRGVDLISDALPFGRLWYTEPNSINK